MGGGLWDLACKSMECRVLAWAIETEYGLGTLYEYVEL